MPQTSLIDLNYKITAALTADDFCLWFPQLTSDLARAEWQNLNAKNGIREENYGTARVILNDSSIPRNIAHTLLLGNQAKEVKNIISVELLPISIADQYKNTGVVFYNLEELLSSDDIHNEILDCLTDAINIIRQVPSLFTTVVHLVKSIHLIKPESDDYDISFSEPSIPFSIFVSAIRREDEINALRIAEAIIHEAMHLQLTLIEKVTPLVFNTGNNYYSPWRTEHRTAGGVLHALYVFRVIEIFFRELLERNFVCLQSANYLTKRRWEINIQINKIQSFSDCRELTQLGKIFVQNLIKPIINTKDFQSIRL